MTEQHGATDAAVTKPAALPDFELPPETSAAVVALLDIGDVDVGSNLVRRAAAIARNYLVSRWLDTVHSDYGESKAALDAMAASLEAALTTLQQLQPLLTVLLIGNLPKSKRKVPEDRSFLDVQDMLGGLAIASRKTAAAIVTRRGPKNNVHLKLAVGSLMVLFEQVAGAKALESTTAVGVWAPELRTPAAKAIGIVLRAADPNITTTAIVNAMKEVRTRPDKWPVEVFRQQVALLDPAVTVAAF